VSLVARVTVKTVAEAVGVSASTVSNAYNRPDQLSPELRARIFIAAEALGYAGPNAAGRMLRRGRAGAVGVLLTERLSYAFSDPYAIGFLKGLTEVVERDGTSIVLLPITLSGEEPDVTSVRQANIDALTSLCVSDTHPASRLAKARGIRLVSTAIEPDPDASWVAIDDERAGALAGAHLAELGHRRVAVIVDTNRPAGQEPIRLAAADVSCIDCSARLRGLHRASPGTELIVVSAGHNAVESGTAAAAFLLDSSRPPTAILGTSDVLALGALQALALRGLSARSDMSVCGFDDIPAAAEAGLTTIRQPIAEKGRRVGELLLDAEASDRQILLPIELVVRSSTGAAPEPRVLARPPAR
jgi:DNA-binding LacI/PurR family transcriptional regulator